MEGGIGGGNIIRLASKVGMCWSLARLTSVLAEKIRGRGWQGKALGRTSESKEKR